MCTTLRAAITNDLKAWMIWERTKRGMLVANLGAYRGVVARTADDQAWTARVEAPDQVYHAVFDYPAMTEAQVWVEQKIEALLCFPRSSAP
ncbi:MAG TPA: hypothetical protein VFZ66_18965 [Herpetosiphonaceae bacterium]